MKTLKTLLIIFCIASVAGAAPTVDLTTIGSSGTINGAIFKQYNPNTATGTGLINSFLRVQENGTEQGYNTDGRPFEAGIDSKTNHTFTRSLDLSFIPVVDFAGTDYSEFLLDINQTKPGSLLSMDALKIAIATEPDLLGYGSIFTPATIIYDMDELANEYVLMDYSLNSGSGDGDVLVYIPYSLFVGGNYVYLYSEFGINNATTAGFEEWAVRSVTESPPSIPAPGAIVLGSIGTAIVGWFRRRKA